MSSILIFLFFLIFSFSYNFVVSRKYSYPYTLEKPFFLFDFEDKNEHLKFSLKTSFENMLTENKNNTRSFFNELINSFYEDLTLNRIKKNEISSDLINTQEHKNFHLSSNDNNILNEKKNILTLVLLLNNNYNDMIIKYKTNEKLKLFNQMMEKSELGHQIRAEDREENINDDDGNKQSYLSKNQMDLSETDDFESKDKIRKLTNIDKSENIYEKIDDNEKILMDWIEHHLALGIQKIIIIDNNSNQVQFNPRFKSLIEQNYIEYIYQNFNILDFLPLDKNENGSELNLQNDESLADFENYNQLFSIFFSNFCLHNYYLETNFLLTLTLDEFLMIGSRNIESLEDIQVTYEKLDGSEFYKNDKNSINRKLTKDNISQAKPNDLLKNFLSFNGIIIGYEDLIENNGQNSELDKNDSLIFPSKYPFKLLVNTNSFSIIQDFNYGILKSSVVDNKFIDFKFNFIENNKNNFIEIEELTKKNDINNLQVKKHEEEIENEYFEASQADLATCQTTTENNPNFCNLVKLYKPIIEERMKNLSKIPENNHDLIKLKENIKSNYLYIKRR